MTSRYTSTYLSIMVATVNRSAASRAIVRRSRLPAAPTAATAESMSSTRKPVTPCVDQLAHRAARVGDDRRAAGHRLDDAVAERLVEVDEVQQGVRSRRALRRASAASTGAEVAHPLAVDVRRDLVAEVLLVLDDPGDVEPAAGSAGDLDRMGGALVGVDPPEEQQVLAGTRVDGERVDVDAVVDGGGVVQTGWRSASLIAT